MDYCISTYIPFGTRFPICFTLLPDTALWKRFFINLVDGIFIYMWIDTHQMPSKGKNSQGILDIAELDIPFIETQILGWE